QFVEMHCGEKRGVGGDGSAGRGRARAGKAYSALSRKAVSWDLESAPTLVAATWPFLNSISVGMPRMPYLAAVSWLSSTLSLATVRRPAYSEATSSRMGAIILQGPHHAAQ